MTLKIGFVGLGMMGLPMLDNLARGGDDFDILAYDRDPARLDRLAAHPAWNRTLRPAADLRALAACDVVITMLPDSTITNAVIEGEDGLAAVMRAGSVLLDMGSSNPAETLRLAPRLRAVGVTLIDAPVSGAVAKAAAGTLAIMVGADAAGLERVRPVLSRMGASLIHTGAVGSAHAMKALNNYVYAAGLLAASEALLIAQRMDLDLDVFTDVLNASSGRNVATETKLRQFVVPGTYNGGFALALMAKDLRTADALQALAGVSATQLSLCTALWQRAREALPAGADNTEIHRYLERLNAPAPA
ncbi:NAD(P)-dependent oxidoreductase [Achromobacter agilis]|uniref:2-(Hydroxymethyl)glutarate dehydrogenase n=1 Tax=Achromobacter agilis TaxID=1353888 RepID=A0A446CQJ4_9BURK|nr:NAD(P)-dependent oxidoreductase [Achromobacter agilis]SSW70063.1 2-(hydroxymethyl)glutarate dehydrogenase [Achromobacter agilis]